MKKKQSPFMYVRWTQSTAACYFHKMICKNCPNEEVCRRVKERINGMHPMKYATLKTYEQLGMNGLGRFINDTRNE